MDSSPGRNASGLKPASASSSDCDSRYGTPSHTAANRAFAASSFFHSYGRVIQNWRSPTSVSACTTRAISSHQLVPISNASKPMKNPMRLRIPGSRKTLQSFASTTANANISATVIRISSQNRRVSFLKMFRTCVIVPSPRRPSRALPRSAPTSQSPGRSPAAASPRTPRRARQQTRASPRARFARPHTRYG